VLHRTFTPTIEVKPLKKDANVTNERIDCSGAEFDLTHHFRASSFEVLFQAPCLRIVRNDGVVITVRFAFRYLALGCKNGDLDSALHDYDAAEDPACPHNLGAILSTARMASPSGPDA